MEKETYNYLIGDVNFANNKDFQTIYASQLYSTFFGIYAKFRTKEHEGNFYLEDAKLKLLNYKGPINLGITNAEFIKLPDKDKDKEYKNWPLGGVFKIEVQALYKSQPEDLWIKNIDPNYPFLQGQSYLCVDRRLKKMHPDDTPLLNGVFDDEFWYRSRFTIKKSKNHKSKDHLEPTFIKREHHPLEWIIPHNAHPIPIVGYPSEWCVSGINAVTWLHE